MSPRFYWSLWVFYFVSAGILWLAGIFTLTTLIVYGFTAFGLVFTGMMCVLPNVVSHPAAETAEQPVRRKAVQPARTAPAPIGLPLPRNV
jgi:hypothetical protein